MKILAPSAQTIIRATGFSQIFLSNDAIEHSVFSGFSFQDETGNAQLFDVPSAPSPMIIEAFAPVSQFERMTALTCREPVFALALDGRGFHGQNGRPWATTLGNLFLCARLPLVQPSFSPLLQAVACLSIISALGEAAAIQWPNDIVLRSSHAKMGGCLTQVDASGVAVTYGIGLNVVHSPVLNDIHTAACVDCFPSPLPENLFQHLLFDIIARLIDLTQTAISHPSAVLNDYRAHLLGVGMNVSLSAFDGDPCPVRGVFDGVTDDLALRLRCHDSVYSRLRMRLD